MWRLIVISLFLLWAWNKFDDRLPALLNQSKGVKESYAELGRFFVDSKARVVAGEDIGSIGYHSFDVKVIDIYGLNNAKIALKKIPTIDLIRNCDFIYLNWGLNGVKTEDGKRLLPQIKALGYKELGFVRFGFTHGVVVFKKNLTL